MTKGKTVVHVDIGERQVEDIQRIDVMVTTKYNTRILYDKWYMTEQKEPNTGHWIKMFLTDTSDIDGQCSECGFIHKFIGGHTAQYNFCPNCGARMAESGDK